MNNFLQPNIGYEGRLARGILGGLLLILGIILVWLALKWWIGLIIICAALFIIFEAISKWCVFRACGIKTKF
jgi:membrane-bound ClpP family serine protease